MKNSSRQSPQLLKWFLSRPLSLRSKLILGNMLITFVAIMAMGYYVYYRTQETNKYLVTKLDQAVQQKAEDKLSTVINAQATQLNSFFTNKDKDITLLGAAIQRLL